MKLFDFFNTEPIKNAMIAGGGGLFMGLTLTADFTLKFSSQCAHIINTLVQTIPGPGENITFSDVGVQINVRNQSREFTVKKITLPMPADEVNVQGIYVLSGYCREDVLIIGALLSLLLAILMANLAAIGTHSYQQKRALEISRNSTDYVLVPM